MLSIFVVVPLAICLLLMAVPVFCFSIVMLVLLVAALPEAIMSGIFGIIGWFWQSLTMGGLMVMVAFGSFTLGSVVIDGLIGRLF